MNDNYLIRPMNLREVTEFAIPLAAKEGWNPGKYDAECFFRADPGGWFTGTLNGEPISCISAVSYGGQFGFIGFYIVKEGHRGMGYGIQIWEKAMQYLGSQNIGLDGVVDQQHNYQKSGFNLAYSNMRFEGTATKQHTDIREVIDLSEVPFDSLLEFDSCYFPVRREEFLKCWIRQPESKSFGIFRGGKTEGYCILRKCRKGYKFGPLFAKNSADAEKLFLAGISSIPLNSPFFLDCPEVNTNAIELAEHYQMKPVFSTARMYTKGEPDLDLSGIYGVTTFELG